MFDYLIQNVNILDGSGRESFPGSVALSGGKIAAAGPGAEIGRASCRERV